MKVCMTHARRSEMNNDNACCPLFYAAPPHAALLEAATGSSTTQADSATAAHSLSLSLERPCSDRVPSLLDKPPPYSSQILIQSTTFPSSATRPASYTGKSPSPPSPSTSTASANRSTLTSLQKAESTPPPFSTWAFPSSSPPQQRQRLRRA